MKNTILLMIYFISLIAHANCPKGIYSMGGEPPFYSYSSNNSELIFCGYLDKETDKKIYASEYDIFLHDFKTQKKQQVPILSFSAVSDTVIYKPPKNLSIKDIWGGFTYTFDTNSLKFIKTFSYKPNEIEQAEYRALATKINNGKMDYMWPWQVLDATLLGYDGAKELFLNLPNLDGAAAEEYNKALKIYEAHIKNM